ncbi:MAG: hypothetical protein PHY64_06465 [Eubacteriales bacterium]|nr:hypothetical protein [Eubacteriales bacterium]
MQRPVCTGALPVDRCEECAAPLRRDEVGISKRLLGRGITRFYCVGCLARRLGVPKAVIELKIQEYRAMGCSLFSPIREGEKNGSL